MTNAEFLNKNFGTHYYRWMKCTWEYSSTLKVWMVEFDGRVRYGWKNEIDGNRVIEHFVESPGRIMIPSHRSFTETYRLVVNKTRGYAILGVYKYDKQNSYLPNRRIWVKVADSLKEFNKEI